MINIITANGSLEFEFLDALKKRSVEDGKEVAERVNKIVEDIKTGGDAALLSYSKSLDNAPKIKRFYPSDFKAAYDSVSEDFKKALCLAAKNITAFHQKQVRQGFSMQNGGKMGQLVRGLERVAIYVPGGTAAYPSTALMCAIPARIAGVKEIIIFSPPSKDGKVNPDILASAHIAGADEIILVGGAHGVAAMAYGTQTIKKADKIVGPGNAYVAEAKRIVYGVCDIDMVAGPSEIMIIADQTASPAFIAADLLSQAEHDERASSILLTTSKEVAKDTAAELKKQLSLLSRKQTAQISLQNYGGIIVCSDREQMITLANRFAPEHLEIITSDADSYLDDIDNAGSIFLGAYTPEALGDYLAGANHVLPTGGTARFFSPLSVDSFVKTIQYIKYDEQAFRLVADDVITLAEREGLDAHAASVKVRLK
ncbi:MAG: histidinol dehydrogenase [Clostridia bacterium]